MISIDPGTRALGWAQWIQGTLHRAGCSIARKGYLEAMARQHADAIGRSVQVVCIESMVARPNTPNAQDLLDVQTVGLLTAAQVGTEILTMTPMQWKGATPKKIHHKRMLLALRPEEIAIVGRACDAAPKNNVKEVLDAVALGLKVLNRIRRDGTACNT